MSAAPERRKDVGDGHGPQVAYQPSLHVGDDKASSRCLPTERFQPRICKARWRIVRMHLEACDRQQAVSRLLVAVSGRAAKASERRSQWGGPGLHGGTCAGHIIVRATAEPCNSKGRIYPPAEIGRRVPFKGYSAARPRRLSGSSPQRLLRQSSSSGRHARTTALNSAS